MFNFFTGENKEIYTIEFGCKNHRYQLKTLAHDKSEAEKSLRRYLSEIHETTIYSISDVCVYHSKSTKEIRNKYKKLGYSVKKLY